MVCNDSEIGFILKNKRQEQGYSIDDIVKNINVKKSYLEAIEKNDFSELPSKVYLKGYVKLYADFLNLRFDNFFEPDRNIESQVNLTEIDFNHLPSAKIIYLTTGLLVILIAIIQIYK